MDKITFIETLTGEKLQPWQRQLIKSIVTEEAESKEPLLEIQVESMESVPTVKYQGKELSGKIELLYEWEYR